MVDKVLIYGAGGFSGRLLARCAARAWGDGRRFQLLLGGRRADTLAPLATELGLPVRVFALDDAAAVAKALAEPGLTTVVNAAGPFAWTGLPLARAAVLAGRHYVDINGEADVYQRMDDLGYVAAQAGVALVAGAGHSATTSDLMLELALREMAAAGRHEAGTIRIAFSHVKHVSQGSAQTAWRSVREQVMVMRGRPGSTELQIHRVPMGQVERTFHFSRPRIASACNLLDLLTARLTAQRHLDSGALRRVRAIEAYIEMPEGARIFVQLGALAAPVLALPGMRQLVQAQVALLPEGPDERERAEDRHQVLLEVDDGFGTRCVDWLMETPDPYEFTADCVVGVVDGLQRRPLAGWRTPAELFDVVQTFEQPEQGLWRDCVFTRRRSPAP
jgi:short subunit dehydrogenase-like uncharacterized protein